MGPVERGIRADLKKMGIDADSDESGAMVALACSLARALDALDSPVNYKNSDKERTGAASIARELRMTIGEIGIGQGSKTGGKLDRLAEQRQKRKGG